MAEADPQQRRTCACCQTKANDGGVAGERIPLDQALCGGCRGKKCLGRCGRRLKAGDVLNTCQACATSVADANIEGNARESGKGLLRCLIAQARGSEDKKYQIKGMRAAFVASINGFDETRHADSLPLEELVLYRAAMAWLRLKDKASYDHIKKPRPMSYRGHTHVKSKRTEHGLVEGRDIQRADGSGPALLETANRRFDGDEPDAEAAELAVKAVAEERRRAYRQNTSSTAVTTAVEGARHDRAATQGERAAGAALRSNYSQTRRRAEDVARGVTAAQRVTYTSAEERDIRNQYRSPAEIETSEAKSQYGKAYRADPDSVRSSVRDGSSTVKQDTKKRKKESRRKGLLKRRERGEVLDGDYVPVGRSKAESAELRREALARKKAGEGTWVECTRCTTQPKWRSIPERPRCVLCNSPDFIVPVSKPESSSSSEEEDDVVVKVEPGGIYRGVVSGRQACALVKLECGDEGSLHYSNCEAQKVPALNATVWVKVLRIEKKDRKIVLSTKNIDQETGKLKIAPDAAGEPVCQGKLDESDWGRSTACRPRKGGRVVLSEGLGDGFTDAELAHVFVVNKTKPGNVTQDLICATRDGTRLRGIPAIRKYLNGLRDDDEEEKARLQRALAMSKERLS